MSKKFVDHRHPLYYTYSQLRGYGGQFQCNICRRNGLFSDGYWICEKKACAFFAHNICLNKTVEDEERKAAELMRDRGTGATDGDRFEINGACGATHQGLLTDEMLNFARNCRMKVLTYNSISCITLLGDYQDSPLINTRHPGGRIKKLLYKFFLVREDEDAEFFFIPKLRECAIEVQHIKTYRKEIYRQVNLYNKMYFLAHDPNVPNIIYAESKITADKKQRVLAFFSNTFNTRSARDDAANLSDFFTNEYKLSMCVMEYMDGYRTLHDYLHEDPSKYERREERVRPYVHLELLLLVCCGFIHTDSHNNNIMINTNMPNYYGPGLNFKIIILDFGRGEDTEPDNLNSLLGIHRPVFERAIPKLQPHVYDDKQIDIKQMVDIFDTFKTALRARRQLFGNVEYGGLEPYTRLKPYLDVLGRKKSKKRGLKK